MKTINRTKIKIKVKKRKESHTGEKGKIREHQRGATENLHVDIKTQIIHYKKKIKSHKTKIFRKYIK